MQLYAGEPACYLIEELRFPLLAFGSLLVLHGRWGLTAGDIAAFTTVLATTYKPVKALSRGWARLMEGDSPSPITSRRAVASRRLMRWPPGRCGACAPSSRVRRARRPDPRHRSPFHRYHRRGGWDGAVAEGQRTLAGIELMNMIKKGQMRATRGDRLTPAEQFYSLAE